MSDLVHPSARRGVRVALKELEMDGVRYWRTQDVLGAVNELLIAARTEDERTLVAWFMRALQQVANKPLGG